MIIMFFLIFQMAESVDLVLDSQNESLISFNQTEEENGTLKNETIDCGVLDEEYIRVWTGFQWWLEGVLFTGLGIAGEVQYVLLFNVYRAYLGGTLGGNWLDFFRFG